MPSFDEPSEDDCPPEHRRGKDIYERICASVREEFKLGQKATTFADEVLERVNALPPDERDAAMGYLNASGTDKSPGFHEGGAH